MRVRFLVRTVYDTNGPGKGPVYEKDSVHDLRPDEAERWFRRSKAVPEPDPAPVPDLAPEVAADPEPAPKSDEAPEAPEPDEPARHPQARRPRTDAKASLAKTE